MTRRKNIVPKDKTIHLRVSANTKELLNLLAKKTGWTKSDVLREAIALYAVKVIDDHKTVEL